MATEFLCVSAAENYTLKCTFQLQHKVNVLECQFGDNRVLHVLKWGDRSKNYSLATSVDQDIAIIHMPIYGNITLFGHMKNRDILVQEGSRIIIRVYQKTTTFFKYLLPT